MMDFYKKANFYFIVAPAAAAVWVLLTSMVFLKSANSDWDKLRKEFDKCKPLITEILANDPDRLEMHKEKEKMGDFDYNTVIGKFAGIHGIPDSVYGLKETGKKRSAGAVTQSARLTIDNIDIVKFTKFLSDMLYIWPDLQCDSLTLKKQSTGPDAWKASLDFKYIFRK